MNNSSPQPNEDRLPADQQRAAEHAHLTPDLQADQAQAGTPQYGDFGHPENASAQPARSGSNDNPDEFSEIRDPEDAIPRKGDTDSGDPNPHQQTGHVAQNRDPGAVRKSQQNDQEEEDSREAWAQDDERYAGGHARASWQDENNKEHDSND